MNIRFAVVDDDTLMVNHIVSLVREWADEKGISCRIDEYPSAEAFLFVHSDEKNFDILLLDIEMNGMNGVEMAKQVRLTDKLCQIIFITCYSDYIADGYDVAALHYLLKPQSKEKFCSVLNRAAEKLLENERAVTITSADGTVRIPMHEIRYIDVFGNYVTIHGKEDYTVKKTLSEIEKLLDNRFFRCGRGFIINLTCISRVTKSEIKLTDGSVLPYPKSSYEALNQAIIAYF